MQSNMTLKELAPDFIRISLLGSDTINVYLLGDVLVDSGPRFMEKKLLSILQGCSLKAHALTHAHFDHQGSSYTICTTFNIPLWCGEGDRAAMEFGDKRSIYSPHSQNLARIDQWLAGPPHPVARILHTKDYVGGFQVIEVPGHTPGHLAFWRENDRVLLMGDVLFHRNPITLRQGLIEPPSMIMFNAAGNRASARCLAALKPSLVCFGHGKELRDTKLLVDFIAGLPAA